MSFFDFFRKKEPAVQAQPEPEQEAPKTRKDMEESLFVSSTRYDEKCKCTFTRTYRPNEESKAMLKEAFDIIASVPGGDKLLDDLAEKGYNVYFDSTHKHSGCLFGKQIMINPKSHDKNAAAMAVTLVHEMTHAMQNEKTNGLITDYFTMNMADAFKVSRACEAAATTEQCYFAYQIKDKHPEALSEVSYLPMWDAFNAEMEKSGDTAKAGEACFKAWYDFSLYRTAYENVFVENAEKCLPAAAKNQNASLLSESISSEQLLPSLFRTEALQKDISPAFLTSQKAFSVTEEAVEKLDNVVKTYTDSFPEKTTKDVSHHNMYSYATGKTHSGKTPDEARPSVMTSLTQINKNSQTQTPQTVNLAMRNKGNER